MAEVRKYFCCTNNLTGCKIIGGVQLALNGILLIISIISLERENGRETPSPNIWGMGGGDAMDFVLIVISVILGLNVLCDIFLIVAASMFNATMLTVWVGLRIIGIFIELLGLFWTFLGAPWYPIISIGLGIWALLIAIGARDEVKSGANIA